MRFNGFFFAINLTGIQSVAYSFPTKLIDDKLIMVGQEDSLTKRMELHGLCPMISKHVFMYHYKSVTIGLAAVNSSLPVHARDKYRKQDGTDSRDELNQYHNNNNQTQTQLSNAILYGKLPKLNFLQVYPSFYQSGDSWINSDSDIIVIGFAISGTLSSIIFTQ